MVLVLRTVAGLQRLLQLQQGSQHPFALGQASNPLASLLLSTGGMNAKATTGFAGTLGQADELGRATGSATSDAQAESLAALAGVQGLLGFGGSSPLSGGAAGIGGALSGTTGLAAGALLRQAPSSQQAAESREATDALNLLARALPRGPSNSRGYGGLPDGTRDGMERY